VRVGGAIALDQQIGDDVGIDDDHSRPAEIATSISAAVSGPPRRRLTGLGKAAALRPSRLARSPASLRKSVVWPDAT